MIKEKLCYVGYNIEQEQKLALETTYLVEPYTVSKYNIFIPLKINAAAVMIELWPYHFLGFFCKNYRGLKTHSIIEKGVISTLK